MSGAPRRPVHPALELARIDGVGLAVCAALAALWYFAGVKPLGDARAEHEVLSAQLSERGATLEDLYTAGRVKQRQVAALTAQIDRGAVKLQPVDQLNRRIAELSMLAGRHGLRIDELKPGAPTPLSRYTTVPIRLAGTATFPDGARFLHDLHEKFSDTGVIAFELRGEPEATDKPPYFAITLLWYAEPLAPSRKGAGAP